MVTIQVVMMGSRFQQNTLPVVYTRGTHYEIGKQMGWTFKERIQSFFKNNISLQERYLPMLDTVEGQEYYQGYLSVSQTTFPQYLQELHGIADGAQMQFKHIFLMHIQYEFEMLYRQQHDPTSRLPSEGCTTILLKGKDQAFLAHNEDVPEDIVDGGFMLSAHITTTEGKLLEHFVAYTYPGMIPGNSFGYNHHGLVHGGNHLEHYTISANRIPRRLLTRAILNAKSIEDAEEVIKKSPPIGCGFTLNLGQMVDGIAHLASIEMYGTDTGTLIETVSVNKIHFHTNLYQKLCVNQYPHRSSEVRLERLRSLTQCSPPECEEDILGILGNKQDIYPIYRESLSPDDLSTAAIGVFNLTDGTLNVYRGNPTVCHPLIQFQIKCSVINN